jgi:hypothetical protein
MENQLTKDRYRSPTMVQPPSCSLQAELKSIPACNMCKINAAAEALLRFDGAVDDTDEEDRDSV